MSTRISRGVIFDNQYEILEFVKSGNHSDVYQVRRIEKSHVDKCPPRQGNAVWSSGSRSQTDNDPPKPHSRGSLKAIDCLEARAFNLASRSHHYLKYGLRSMNRLKRRTILKTKWNHLDVIIYNAGLLVSSSETNRVEPSTLLHMPWRPDRDSMRLRAAWSEMMHRDKAASTDSAPRTEWQKESRRLRQLDRRIAKRLRTKPEIQGLYDFSGYAFDKVAVQTGGQFNSRSFLLLLEPNKSQHFELAVELLMTVYGRAIEDNYARNNKLPQFASQSEIQSFINIKSRQIAFLKSHLHKLPAAATESNKWVKYWLREKRKLPTSVPLWGRRKGESDERWVARSIQKNRRDRIRKYLRRRVMWRWVEPALEVHGLIKRACDTLPSIIEKTRSTKDTAHKLLTQARMSGPKSLKKKLGGKRQHLC